MTAGYPNIRKRPDIRYLSNQSPMHQWCGSGIRICIVGNLLDPVLQGGSGPESRRQKWRTICQKCWKLCFKSLNIFYKYVRFFSYKTITVKKKTKNKNYYFPYKHCIKFFRSIRPIFYSLDPDPLYDAPVPVCGSTSLWKLKNLFATDSKQVYRPFWIARNDAESIITPQWPACSQQDCFVHIFFTFCKASTSVSVLPPSLFHRQGCQFFLSQKFLKNSPRFPPKQHGRNV